MRRLAFKTQRITTIFVLVCIFLTLFSTIPKTEAAPNYQMNYQGKLLNASNVAVADGTYNMRFWLLTSSSIATTSALWTELLTGTNKVQVTNGLFSVMLGSTTPLTGVDFNQPLYLGVEIGGTSTPAWDGEMSPRKILGTVPSAFEAKNTQTFAGIATTSFLRSDQADSASSLLTFTGGIVSNSSSTITNLTSLIATTTTLVINNSPFTSLTGTGLSNSAGVLTCATASGSTQGCLTSTDWNTFNQKVSSTSIDTLAELETLQGGINIIQSTEIDTSSELATLITDETGTAGNLVFSGNPLLAGFRSSASSTIGDGTGAGGLTINGGATTTGNAYFAGNVGIGTVSPSYKLDVNGTIHGTIARVSNRNPFGDNTFYASELHNYLFAGVSRFNISQTGFASFNAAGLFNGSGEDFTSGQVATSTTAVLTVDLTKETGVNGISYPQGYIYATFYFTGVPASVTARVQYRDGSWVSLGTPTNVSTVPTYAIWRFPVSATQYLTTIELTVNASVGTVALLTEVEYNLTRPSNLPLAYVDKFSAQNLYYTTSWKDTNNVSQIALNPSGNSYINAGNVGIGTTSPSRKLTVAGDAWIGGNLTATGTATIGSLTGLLKGTSGVVSVASSGTDYEVPLTFSNGLTRTTNNIAPTTGYNIPLTASTTNWNNFFDTPSTVITAGTGIDWSGNTLNGVYTAGDGITLNTEDFDCDTASSSIFGCLSTTDWTSFNNKISSTSIDTSSELATLITDETGTAGNLVFSGNPLLAGFRSNASSTIGNGTATGGLTINGGATTTAGLVMSGSASNIALGSNYLSGDGGDEGIFVDASGNVGIGTAAPVSKLRVASTNSTVWQDSAFTQASTFSYTPFSHELTLVNSQDSTTGSFASIFFNAGTEAGTSVASARIGVLKEGISTGGAIVFANRSVNSNMYERMRISSDGNVGIGTTTPTTALTIQTASFTGPNIYGTQGSGVTFGLQSAATGGRHYYFQSSANSSSLGGGKLLLVDGTAGAARFAVDSTGNVGIGTTTPSLRLTVAGDAWIGGNLTATGTATIGSLTGLLKGTSGVVSVASSGTDYEVPLTFSNGLTRTTNNIAPTTGYNIPLTASTTNWNGFYDVPSTRITAGTGIDWTGNTLNGVYTAGDGITLNTEDFDCDTASSSIFGCLSTTDWTSFNNKISSTSIDTSSELATLITDETGTAGNLVFSGNPLLAGFRSNASSTIGGGTGATGLTINGGATTTLNQYIGGNLTVLDRVTFDDTDFNTKIGYQAGKNIVSGTRENTFLGYQAGYSSSTASNSNAGYNSAFGYRAFYSNTTGADNTAIGGGALYSNTTGTNNTANGEGALYYNTTGTQNTANGRNALVSNTTGNANTANGAYALVNNTTGFSNTANGYQALYYNTTGGSNTALGYDAGHYYGSGTFVNQTSSSSVYLGYSTRAGANGNINEIVIGHTAIGSGSNSVTLGSTTITKTVLQGNVGIGSTTPSRKLTVDGGDGWFGGNLTVLDRVTFDDTDYNTKIGYQAGKNIVAGAQYNTFSGYQAGLSSSTASTNGADYNSAFGYQSLYSNTTGNANTAIGTNALYSNTSGYENTAIGTNALYSNTDGESNTANGMYALYSNTTGGSNTANGAYALRYNTTGWDNTANGMSALYSNTTGSENTANGMQSLYSNTTGFNNTANGAYALYNNTTGGSNTALGYDAGAYYGSGTSVNQTSSSSVYLGYSTRAGADGNINEIVIGHTAIGSGSNSVTLGSTTITKTILQGNVGIGTSTPSSKLTVQGSGTTNPFLVASSTGSTLLGVDTQGRLTIGDIPVSQTADDVNTFINGGTSNATAFRNVAIGSQTYMYVDDFSSDNIAIGYQALRGSSTTLMSNGSNVAIGSYALRANTSGYSNIAIGNSALYSNTTGGSSVAVGESALSSNTTGYWNTALGYSTLSSNTIGERNTAVGNSALYKNISGQYNTGSGYSTLFANTTGYRNTAFGAFAGSTNTVGTSTSFFGYGADASSNNLSTSTAIGAGSIVGCSNCLVLGGTGLNAVNVGIGTSTPSRKLTVDGGDGWFGGNLTVLDRVTFDDTDFNTKIGYQAGKNIVAGAQNNTFSGYQAGLSSSTASTGNADNNSAFGYQSFYSNTTGWDNTANGMSALYSNTSGFYNTASGAYALYSNTTGNYNTANGVSALLSNTTGSDNTANGADTLRSNTTGFYNTANGRNALYSNTTGFNNTANGYQALYNNTTGGSNTALGYDAGHYYGSGTSANQTSSSSVYLGYSTRAGANGNINEIVIGHTAIGSGSNSVTLGSTTITKTVLQGNVGIGTSSPFAKLTVVGDLSFGTDSLDTSSWLYFGSQKLATASTTSNNTFFGLGAGTSALYRISNGDEGSTAFGKNALNALTTGGANTAFGALAMSSAVSVSNSVAIGHSALTSATSSWADFSVAVGDGALEGLMRGQNNIGIGYLAGSGIGNWSTSGWAPDNIAIGAYAMDGAGLNMTANTGIGSYAMESVQGTGNAGIGYGVLNLLTNGSYNTAQGYSAGHNLGSVATSSGNLFLGYKAAYNQTQGDYNILLGYNNNFASTTGSNQLNIGNLIYGTGLGVNGVASTGNVGIGTTTPTALLTISNSINTPANTALFTIASTTGGTATTTLFQVTATGNVDMKNGGASDLEFTLDNGTATGIFEVQTNNVVRLGTFTNNSFEFITNNTARLKVTNTGNVGIGSTTPSRKLTVDGGDGWFGGNLTVFDRVTFDDTDYNTKIGYQAGKNIVAGAQYNTFSGYQAGFSSSTASNSNADANSAFGYQALYSNTTGYQNTANGIQALRSNTTGYNNTANGVNTLVNNTTGWDNTANGAWALYYNTTGSDNTANGYTSLYSNTTGLYNTANGFTSLYSNTIGGSNTANGMSALYSNTSGSNNTALGYDAGHYYGSGTSANQTSNNSVYLGYDTRAGANGNTNEIVIGHTAIGSGSNSVTLGSTTITKTILQGNVGIGTTTPTSLLTMGTSSLSGAQVAGVKQYFGFTNSVASAVYYGDETYIVNAPTATSTLVGKMIRVQDDTSLGNIVRGFEVQAYRGTNTKGENTGLSGFGRTFGVRGTTIGDAGDTFLPAGVYAETQGTTQGNALRAYSGTVTTENLVSLFQDTSIFSGTGIQMNFGNAGGSFAATSSAKFFDLKVAGTSKFIVSANGSTTIGDGTVSASLMIPRGGICVDNDGSCISTTTGQIRSVTSALGNSDLAEMYFSSESLHTGEIVSLVGGLSMERASVASEQNIIGVVSTKPGMTLGFDDSSLIAGESAYPVGLKGRVPIKLSTENGPIKKGDRITVSSIPGVGMKAIENSRVVGIALEDYDGTTAYSDGFLNQFGDDMVKERIATKTLLDPHTEDGCYNGAGTALGENPCNPKSTPKTMTMIVTDNTEYKTTLIKLKKESPQMLTTETGENVAVGQALMFIELGWYQNASTKSQLAELLATSTVMNGNGTETLWDRIKTLAQNFVDGVLTIAGIKADRVEVKNELCVDGVCLNADDLRALLHNVGRDSSVRSQNQTNDTLPSSAPSGEASSVSGSGTDSGSTTVVTSGDVGTGGEVVPSDTTPVDTTIAPEPLPIDPVPEEETTAIDPVPETTATADPVPTEPPPSEPVQSPAPAP